MSKRALYPAEYSMQRACQVLATLCLEYHAVPACLEGC